MKIRSERGTSAIILTPKEKGPDGSIKASVTVTSEGFVGINRKVWLSPLALKAFLEQLRTLNEYRKGEALIEALSPKEFRLAIRITDLSGHVSAFVDIAQLRSVFGRWAKNSLSVEFALDPSLLPHYLAEAECFACSEGKPEGREKARP